MSRRLGDRVRALDHPQRTLVRQHARLPDGPARAGADRLARPPSRRAITCSSRTGGRCRSFAPTARAPQVGITLNLCPAVPASASREDHDATRHFDGHFNRWFLDPLYRGRYPSDIVADYVDRGHLAARRAPRFSKPGDLKAIAAAHRLPRRQLLQPRRRAQRPHPGAQEPAANACTLAPKSEWHRHGLGGLPGRPLPDPRAARVEYAVPKMYVTENGASYADGPDQHGRVADARRLRYIRDHLVDGAPGDRARRPAGGVLRLVAARQLRVGAWLYGQRFGITWVDYATQRARPEGQRPLVPPASSRTTPSSSNRGARFERAIGQQASGFSPTRENGSARFVRAEPVSTERG